MTKALDASTHLINLLTGLAILACPGSAQSFQNGERTIQPVGGMIAQMGGADEDTLLFKPTDVSLVGEQVFVWDEGRSAVLALSLHGTVDWRYGGQGGGPGEFAGVRGIDVDDRGRTWVLDPNNLRVSILTPFGTLQTAFRMPIGVGYLDRLSTLGGSRALLMGSGPVVHVIDDRGRVLTSRPHPYAGMSDLHMINGYNAAIRDARSDSIAFFFYYGGGFVRTDSALSRVAALTPYVEKSVIPDVEVQVTRMENGGTRTVTGIGRPPVVEAGVADGGVLHLLIGDHPDYPNRLVDRYSIGSGEYLGSWLLPAQTSAFDVSGDRIATLEANPFPELIVRRTP